jgi:hypothetical protein
MPSTCAWTGGGYINYQADKQLFLSRFCGESELRGAAECSHTFIFAGQAKEGSHVHMSNSIYTGVVK